MLNDIVEEFPIAHTFRLEQNYPNPFNPATQIQYNLPLTSFVTLKVYDVMGRELVTLVSERQNPGLYSVKLDVGSFAAGIYFYRLSAGLWHNETSTR
ncbi:MAG: T9SS type A sorting domain-containing protein [Bacteroidota bacterium]|nr:T9SS type A sorting domain-containing protein [Bacteroidota bacterium]